MTRNHETSVLLRSLDPADRDASPSSPRARADLERILLSDPPAPVDARSTGRRKRPVRLAVAAGAVATVVAAAVVLPSVTGGDRAFATWTQKPDGLSAAARADAAGACRRAQDDGPGTEYQRELSAADTAIVERRGVWIAVVLAGSGGFSAMCVTDDSKRLFDDWIGSIGTRTDYTAPGARDVIATDLGTGQLDAGELSLAAGETGSDVVGVVYRSPDRGNVAATVATGHFALWLPGDELENAGPDGVEVQVTFRDGTTEPRKLHL